MVSVSVCFVGFLCKLDPKPKYSTREACGFITCLWIQNPKDHINTLFRDTHWISYAIDKILFHYCSGDSWEYNASFLQFNAFALEQVKDTAQAQ